MLQVFRPTLGRIETCWYTTWKSPVDFSFPSGLSIFPGRKLKVAGALFLEVFFKIIIIFLSLSNPFLMERVPLLLSRGV